MISCPPLSLRYENFREIEKFLDRLLLEDAKSDLCSELWLLRKARKFIIALNDIVHTRDTSKIFMKKPSYSEGLGGPCIKVDDINYVFTLPKTNCAFYTDSEDQDNTIYIGILIEEDDLTLSILHSLLYFPNLENSIIHELTHTLDYKRYKGDVANIDTSDNPEKYYNSGLEFNSHFNEVLNPLYKYIKTELKKANLNILHDRELKNNVVNTIINEIKLARNGKEPVFFDKTLNTFIRHLNKKMYHKLLNRIGEIIEWEYEKIKKQKSILYNKKPKK